MSFTHSANVFRAAKVVAEQAGCRIEEALARMHERAEEAGMPIDKIATDVLDPSHCSGGQDAG